MDFVLIAIAVVLALAIWSGFRRGMTGGASPSRSTTTSPRVSSKQKILNDNDDWLRERWRMADAELATGDLRHFSKWYFDPPTDRQRERLAKEGVSLGAEATKGQMSDVIGLFEEPEDEDIEKLRFFGIALKGLMLTQTRARHEIAKIQSDPEKERAWLLRPASAIQKEFYAFIGEKVPARLTHEQADARMTEALKAMSDEQQDEWASFETILEEFNDRQFRSDVEIRKPSPADIRAAMLSLKAAGQQFDDPFEVADKLLELKPALARAASR